MRENLEGKRKWDAMHTAVNKSHCSHLTSHRSSGITLVALVVTIVVLLILAGVTIATLFGENGIITSAQKASDATKRAQIISSIQLDVLEKELEKSGDDITQADFEGILAKYAKGGADGILKDDAGNIIGIEVEGLTDPIDIADLYTGNFGEGGGIAENPENPENPEEPEEPEATIGPNGKPLVATVTTTDHETIIAEDSLGNTVVVPKGFKVAEDSGKTVQQGIVIEDGNITANDITNGITRGNQFVWIPVSNINGDGSNLIKLADGTEVEITLGRYLFDDDTGEETIKQYGANYTSTIKIDSYNQELSTFRESNYSDGTGRNKYNSKRFKRICRKCRKQSWILYSKI